MNKFDEAFEDKLEKTIEEIEEKTSVEIVVTITPSADSYVDTYLKSGLALLAVMLLFLWYAPIDFPPELVPVDLAGSFILGVIAVWLLPPLKRLLIWEKRKERYVNRAANAYFRENGLTRTIERTAFLLYISVLERKCKLIGDDGVMSAVPAGEWKEIEAKFQTELSKQMRPGTILELLPMVIEPFAKYLPPAEDNIDELSNRLRRL